MKHFGNGIFACILFLLNHDVASLRELEPEQKLRKIFKLATGQLPEVLPM